MSADIGINSARNGYIIRTLTGTEVYRTLEEVFERILLYYEGRSPTFAGSGFGKVEIVRGSEEE